MPGDPRESSFMRAARHEVDVLVRQSRMNRLHIYVLYGAATILVGAVIVLMLLLSDQHRTDAGLRNAITMNCQSGNSFRAAQTQIWEGFISLALKGGSNHSAQAQAEAAGFLRFVEKTDQLRNCASLSRAPAARP